MDGTPVDVAISPDGSKIAYTLASASCPPGAPCGARAATGYVTAAGDPLPGNLCLSDPSWASDARTLLFGCYLPQVNTHDLGAAEDVHWFDDQDVVGQADATDLGDGELSRAGDRLALVRGYGSDISSRARSTARSSRRWSSPAGASRIGVPPTRPPPARPRGPR